MSIPIYHIDAFADTPFTGNPACVCLMSQSAETRWLQSVAAEMNLSETAFVWKRKNRFDLRWFTPLEEVRLCGHATLAAAQSIWEHGWLSIDAPAIFDTLSGRLSAAPVDGRIELDLPAHAPRPAPAPDGLWEALRVEAAVYVGFGGDDYLVQLDTENAVRNVDPDFRKLATIPARGFIVTAPSADEKYDFVSRFFAPALGIDEDPVTGSAHCVLAPFWSRLLGRRTLNGWQVSPRGGVVSMRMRGQRVDIGGRCVCVLTGHLRI